MAISIGIVGLGQIARKRHVPAIAANASFTLAGLADLGGGEPVAGLPIYTDHHAMFAACALDAVAICTPPAARFAIARDALRAGKHVLLEKPPAATMGEAEALVQLAAHCGGVVYA
ncbi:MAG: Gfo/Idh/MocA family protein, partial [Alphaproteobacteria bacterium]